MNKVLESVHSATRRSPRKSRGARLFKQDMADTVNKDGYPAYTHSLEADIARLALTGVIRNRFYSKEAEQAGEMHRLFKQGATHNPEFLLKCAKVARKQNMKLAPKMALAALAALAPNTVREHDADAIALLSTYHPKQLLEFVDICRNRTFGKGFGSREQRWVRSVLHNVSDERLEEWTLKYRQDLRTLGLLVHLKRHRPALDFCFGGEGKGNPITDKQKAWAELKEIKDARRWAQRMVDAGVPWDACKAFAPKDPVAHAAMMMNAGPMAVLLNTRSYEEHRVFESDEAVKWYRDWALETLPKARLLPLDILKPVRFVSNRSIKDALLDGMAGLLEKCAAEPTDARVAVLMDVSGSMKGEPLQEQAVMAATVLLSCQPVFAAAFDTQLYMEDGQREVYSASPQWHGYCAPAHVSPCPRITGRTDWRQLLRELLSMRHYGGTDTGIGIAYMMQAGLVADVICLFTDEQQNTGSPSYEAFARYRRQVNPDAHLVIVNTQGYPWHNVPEVRNVTVFNSVHPAIMRYVGNLTGDPVARINELAQNEVPLRPLASSPES